MIIDPKIVTINHTGTIRECMRKINRPGNYAKTLYVTDNGERLLGSLTDGDIRRAFLSGYSMDSPVGEICKKSPVVVPEGMPEEQMNQLLLINNITSLPIIDRDIKIVGVKQLESLSIEPKKIEALAIIMAGGEGKRLRPFTDDTPKPMLKIGGKPLLQIIIESLRDNGFKTLFINIRYLGEKIKDYFKDGSHFKVNIEYLNEPKAMGTAGSIGLIPEKLRPTSSFLVVNGDILTTLNFKSFRDFHIATKYDLTLCGRPYQVKIPFGYPVIEGDLVTDFREKPEFTHLVNSGIYCISPNLINKVPSDEYFDMPDLIRAAIEDDKRVGVFPLREEFHEIGRPESYKIAEEFYSKNFVQEEDRK